MKYFSCQRCECLCQVRDELLKHLACCSKMFPAPSPARSRSGSPRAAAAAAGAGGLAAAAAVLEIVSVGQCLAFLAAVIAVAAVYNAPKQIHLAGTKELAAYAARKTDVGCFTQWGKTRGDGTQALECSRGACPCRRYIKQAKVEGEDSWVVFESGVHSRQCQIDSELAKQKISSKARGRGRKVRENSQGIVLSLIAEVYEATKNHPGVNQLAVKQEVEKRLKQRAKQLAEETGKPEE
eukprot:Hpha_TRINITY_DN16474_c1_g2::TRINITY_DN16474_c1_g2_i17::g.160330::m.160330